MTKTATKKESVSGTGTMAVALSDEAYRKIQALEGQLKRMVKRPEKSGEILKIRSQIDALERNGMVPVGGSLASFTH